VGRFAKCRLLLVDGVLVAHTCSATWLAAFSKSVRAFACSSMTSLAGLWERALSRMVVFALWMSRPVRNSSASLWGPKAFFIASSSWVILLVGSRIAEANV